MYRFYSTFTAYGQLLYSNFFIYSIFCKISHHFCCNFTYFFLQWSCRSIERIRTLLEVKHALKIWISWDRTTVVRTITRLHKLWNPFALIVSLQFFPRVLLVDSHGFHDLRSKFWPPREVPPLQNSLCVRYSNKRIINYLDFHFLLFARNLLGLK